MARRIYDVAVVGLGAHGSAIAAHCATRGLSVIGLEQYSPAHSNGSSHGRSRIFRTAYAEHPSYVPLLQRALELWKGLCERDLKARSAEEGGRRGSTVAGTSGLEPLMKMTGAMTIGPAEDLHTGNGIIGGTMVGEENASIKEHGLRHEVWSPAEVSARFPVFRMQDDEVAVFEKDAALLVPERCIEAHLCEAEASGNATLCFNETMLSWEEESSPSSMLEQQTTKRHRELGSSETPSAGAGNSAHDGNGAGAGNGASADGESGAAQKGERDENDDINNDTSSGGDNDDEDDDQPPPPFLVRTSAGKEYLARKVVLSVGAWAGKEYGEALQALGLQLSVERRVIHWFKPTTTTTTTTTTQTVEVEIDNDDPSEPHHKARRQSTTPPQIEPTHVGDKTASLEHSPSVLNAVLQQQPAATISTTANSTATTAAAPPESLFSDLPVYMLAPRLRKKRGIAGGSGKDDGAEEEEAEEQEVYGFPLQDASEGVKVAIHGGLGTLGQQLAKPEDLRDRPEVLPSEVDQVRASLRSKLPELARGQHVKSVACMYTFTPNEHFFIDWHPGRNSSPDGNSPDGSSSSSSSISSPMSHDSMHKSGNSNNNQQQEQQQQQQQQDLKGRRSLKGRVLLVSPCSGHGFKFSSVLGEACATMLGAKRTMTGPAGGAGVGGRGESIPDLSLELFTLKEHLAGALRSVHSMTHSK